MPSWVLMAHNQDIKEMIKSTILLRRKKGLSHQDFIWYYKNNNGPLFKSLPEVQQYVRRYVQCYSLQETFAGLPLPAYDAITELWFDDLESMFKLFATDSYLQKILPDEENFLDLSNCSIHISTEHIVI